MVAKVIRGLAQAECGRDHADRPVGGLGLSPPEQVVGDGLLEEGQVQLGRLLHHQERDLHRDSLLEQLLGDVADRAEQRGEGVDRELDHGQSDDAPRSRWTSR